MKLITKIWPSSKSLPWRFSSLSFSHFFSLAKELRVDVKAVLNTEFKEIDDFVKLNRGKLIILKSKPSIALSTFALNIATNDKFGTVYVGDKLTQGVVQTVLTDDAEEITLEEYNVLMENSQRGADGFGSSDVQH